MKLAAGVCYIVLLIISLSCGPKSELIIEIESNKSNYDTLFIKEISTGRTIAKVPLNKTNVVYRFPINESTLGDYSIKEIDRPYLTILCPNVKKVISIDTASIRTLHSIPDSLVNSLWKTTNEMFSKHDKVIFAQNNPDRVRSLFDSLIQVRSIELQRFKSQLSADEFGILDYQNKARAYSFLMFYGRIIKNYSPDNQFFNFIDSIETKNIYSKTLPNNVLYKLEIEFLKENDSIPSIDSFLEYIEGEIDPKLQDFLKAMYLKEVIESPSYWRRHEKLFNAISISEALVRERKNQYAYLIEGVSNSFFASQKGVKGFDFTATRQDGTTIRLSDLRGKIVVIDTWATWCGPCIAHRPRMLEIARKYGDHPKVAILLISVDSSVDKWKKYINGTNVNGYGNELHIPNGMSTSFGDKYLISAIPKYILIDSEGIIVNSNLPEPSERMEQIINQEIEKLLGALD